MPRKLIRLALLPFAFLCVAIVRLLDKCGVLIRFGELWSERIGHLAGNTETYLCEREAGLHPKSLDIWTHRKTVSNRQLAAMISRVMWVDPTRFTKLVMLCNMLFRGWEKHSAGSTQIDRDVHNLYEKQKPHLYLTREEEIDGWETVRSWGIPKGAKWVCLIVRDKAYLPTMHHHDYRDSDVDTYEQAILALAERGYYVFRMGAKVLKPLKVNHPKVFDYATNGMHSDFMSIYLGAKCEFCISSGTGFDAIPVIFRRPVVFVNYAPVEYMNTWVNPSLAIWKHHYKDGKRMSFKEIVESGAGQFMATQQFQKAGINLTDNTPEEIRDVVLEMEDTVFAGLPPSSSQEWFWRDFPKSISPYNSKPLHGEIRMRIGSKFLDGQKTRTPILAPSS